jgi:DNA-binding GntR family transcriptional regulator
MLGVDPGSGGINREVLSSQVKDRILQWILEGELPPGSRIVETRVAKQLGVSQAPVREALRDLASVGIVEVAPYRGASVREPSRSELIEAMAVRGELEAIGARWAAERITDSTLEDLRRLIEAMQEAARDGDTHQHALINTQFHQAIMEASGNRSLVWMWSLLEPMARTYFTATAPGIDLVWLGDRHLPILEALEARDSATAADVMRAHSKEAEELVLRHYQSTHSGSTQGSK